jgi:hypothetical protein
MKNFFFRSYSIKNEPKNKKLKFFKFNYIYIFQFKLIKYFLKYLYFDLIYITFQIYLLD